ncbi:hypothetical protein SFRURICE_018739 [Spodoptera frugiperda]|nr:hypothetical protein SFRURICE_018739 [Spodoptera frugiperda]
MLCLRLDLVMWSSCKCDCRARDLGFDSRVGLSIAGLFSVSHEFLSSGTETGNVPDIYGNRLTLYYTGLTT